LKHALAQNETQHSEHSRLSAVPYHKGFIVLGGKDGITKRKIDINMK